MSNIIDTIRLSGTDYTLSATSSGVSVVEVTQAVYDALPSSAKTDTSKMYVITDAQAGDLTNYYTKTETNTLLGSKQATLVSGTNIKTVNNESLLGSGNIDIQGGGGKSVEAGRGISVASGDSAYTVSFNLPMSAGTSNGSILENRAYESTGDYAHAEGDYTHAKGSYSHAEGGVTYATGSASHAEGFESSATSMYSHAEGETTKTVGRASHTEGSNTIANNQSEHASGQYNVSSKASTTFGDSGNTLFSVGNGTSNSARHNAFEIRQNGDIYLSSGGTDIKLQDHLGGGGTTYSAGTNIDITNDIINCTLPIYSGKNLDGTAAGAESIRFSTRTSFGSSKGLRSIRGRYNSNALGEESICFGVNSYVRGDYSFGVGRDFDSYGEYTTIFGYGTQTKNIFETAIGKHNTSNSGSTDADNTLFSVGNGASNSVRHNALEIRQNGDIYCSDGTNDVKLQDTITATASNTTALGGLKLVKLTQSAYDALSPNYDSNTLYVIVN